MKNYLLTCQTPRYKAPSDIPPKKRIPGRSNGFVLGTEFVLKRAIAPPNGGLKCLEVAIIRENMLIKNDGGRALKTIQSDW